MSFMAQPSRRLVFTSCILLIAIALVPFTHATVKRKPSQTDDTALNPYHVGRWEPSFTSVIVVHASVLPNGKVLHWSPGFNQTPSRLWNCVLNNGLCDPDVNSNNLQDIFYAPSDLFCSGHSFLPDGRLLAVGGSVFGSGELGTIATTIFAANPQPSPSPYASSGPNMTNGGRWYPSTVTLGNGETAFLSGWQCGPIDPCTYQINTIPEVINAAGTSLRSLSGASLSLPLFPRLHLAADGRVFYAGPNSPSRWLDTTGTGSWGNTLKHYFYSQAPYFITDRDSGASVMYDVDKVMIAGGSSNPPTNTCEKINLKGEVGNWEATGSMQYARRHLNLTILADGKVLATGGTQGPGFDDNCIENTIFAAELWDPLAGNGTWTTMASMKHRRQYHSTAVLLIDGRVLVGGNTGSNQNPDCKPNNPVYEQEIFTPPYLFNPNGTLATRPVITSAPDSVGYGTSFLVGSPSLENIAKVTMVRLSSVTHSVNMNQRINHLEFTRVGAGLRVVAPASGNEAPPGHYMLFIINRAGVPSVAKVIKIG